MKHRDGLIFLVVGAAAFGVTKGGDELHLALLVMAFAGVWIVTGVDRAKWLMVAPAASYALAHLWTAVPGRLTPATGGTLYGLPEVLGSVVLLLAFLASVVVAARSVGWGLATVAGTALVLRVGSALLAFATHALSETLSRDLGAQMRGAGEWYGQLGGAGVVLVPACWIVLALAPHEAAPIRSRKLAGLGVAGALILRAALDDMADGQGRRSMTVPVVLFAIGGLLTILGAIGVARSGGRGLAWAGVVLLVLQIVQCVATAASVSANVGVVASMWLTAAPIGLALVAFSSELPVRPLRILAGAFFVAAAAGSLFQNVGIFLDLARVVRISGDPTQWWTYKRMAVPGMGQGLLVWCAVLAYLVAPPRTTAAKAA